MSFLRRFSDNNVTTLTDATTIDVDMQFGPHFQVTLEGNRTLGNPTNLSAAKEVWVAVRQDAIGGRTLEFDTDWVAIDSTTTINSAANSVTVIYAVARDFGDGTKWYYVVEHANETSGAGSGTVDFNNYYSPIAAYLFDGTNRTVDRSGNGYTLTPSGTLYQSPSYAPGITSTWFDSSRSVSSSAAPLNITGACSIELVCNVVAFVSESSFAYWAGSGETESNNVTWSIGRCAANDGVLVGLQWETGAGVDVVVNNNHGKLYANEWIHMMSVRSADGTLTTYINGAVTGSTAGLTMPTGGTSGMMMIGGGFHHSFRAQYFAIYNTDLTDVQVLTLARKRMGW